jgi:hypothetical protein
VKFKEFKRGLKEKDFAVGDSFWLGDIEFEVKNKRKLKM